MTPGLAYRIALSILLVAALAMHLGGGAARVATGQTPAFSGSIPAPGGKGLLVTARQVPAGDLDSALGDSGCDASVFAVLESGVWTVYVVGVPAVVNAAFPSELAASTPFFARCRETAPAVVAGPTVAPTGGPDTAAGPTQGGCISDPNPRLTHFYTDLDQIEFINPTIVTSGNWLKNRQYHKVVTDANNEAPKVPVYAPADATAVGITHYLGLMQPWVGEPFELSQFDVRFEVSCEVSFWFDHLSRLAESFASLAPAEGVRDTRDAQVPIRVEVQAGDLIGYSSGTEPAHVWDFILVNTSKTNRFANQQRYEQTGDLEHLLHGDCPYDYYDQSMRAEYVVRFGSWQGRADGFYCDDEVDVVGTVAGGWFLTPFAPGAPYAPADWGVVVKLAADGYLDVNGPSASVRTGPEAPTFADPKLVTGERCFQHYVEPTHYAYLKVLSDTQLAAAFGDGSCPSVLPAEHQIYHR